MLGRRLPRRHHRGRRHISGAGTDAGRIHPPVRGPDRGPRERLLLEFRLRPQSARRDVHRPWSEQRHRHRHDPARRPKHQRHPDRPERTAACRCHRHGISSALVWRRVERSHRLQWPFHDRPCGTGRLLPLGGGRRQPRQRLLQHNLVGQLERPLRLQLPGDHRHHGRRRGRTRHQHDRPGRIHRRRHRPQRQRRPNWRHPGPSLGQRHLVRDRQRVRRHLRIDRRRRRFAHRFLPWHQRLRRRLLRFGSSRQLQRRSWRRHIDLDLIQPRRYQCRPAGGAFHQRQGHRLEGRSSSQCQRKRLLRFLRK